MLNVENEGRPKYSKFDKMETSVLEAILRADFDAPEAERLDVEVVIYISNLLAERQNTPKPDVNKAKDEFFKYYYPLEKSIYDFGDEDDNNFELAPETDKHKTASKTDNAVPFRKRLWRGFASAAAVFVIFMFGGTFTAYAFGYNPIAAIGRWSEDFFWFEDPPVKENVVITEDLAVTEEAVVTEEAYVTSELDGKLAEYGYPENIVPKWLPPGYTLDSIDANEYEGAFKYIGATFVKQTDDETDTLIISYTINLGNNNKTLYFKDNGDVLQYAIKDRVYYVMTNLDGRIIAWQNGNFEGAIMGKFTIEEAEKIIKSIDEE